MSPFATLRDPDSACGCNEAGRGEAVGVTEQIGYHPKKPRIVSRRMGPLQERVGNVCGDTWARAGVEKTDVKMLICCRGDVSCARDPDRVAHVRIDF